MNRIQFAYTRFGSMRFPLPTEEQVTALEGRLELTFPPAYRCFLLEFNGGYFRPEPLFTGPALDCPRSGLDMLAGIGATVPSAELGRPQGLHPRIFDDNDPPQVLPIGYTPLGQLLYMIVDPKATITVPSG